MLIPGFGCGPSVWFKVRDRLATKFQLHMITVPGFAGTPPMFEPPILPALRDNVIAYCESLVDPVLVGHSFGGTMTLWAAARARCVRAAIVVDGLPYYATVLDLNATPESMEDEARRQMQQIMNGRLRRREPTYFDKHLAHPGDANFLNARTPPADRRTMAQMRYEVLTTDLRSEMANIRAPVLLVGAGKPWIDSVSLKEIAAWYRTRLGSIPNVDLVVNTRAGHFVMVDDPDGFLEQVEAFHRPTTHSHPVLRDDHTQ